MAGIDYSVDEFSQEEGVLAIKEIEKHRQRHNNSIPKLTYEEFCKQ